MRSTLFCSGYGLKLESLKRVDLLWVFMVNEGKKMCSFLVFVWRGERNVGEKNDGGEEDSE